MAVPGVLFRLVEPKEGQALESITTPAAPTAGVDATYQLKADDVYNPH